MPVQNFVDIRSAVLELLDVDRRKDLWTGRCAESNKSILATLVTTTPKNRIKKLYPTSAIQTHSFKRASAKSTSIERVERRTPNLIV
jgi:hypothetical protein